MSEDKLICGIPERLIRKPHSMVNPIDGQAPVGVLVNLWNWPYYGSPSSPPRQESFRQCIARMATISN